MCVLGCVNVLFKVCLWLFKVRLICLRFCLRFVLRLFKAD